MECYVSTGVKYSHITRVLFEKKPALYFFN